MKKQNGITLIALVITIIVLLILAGVSINLVLGESGVLNKAQNAVNLTKTGKAIEQVVMAWGSCETEYLTTGKDKTKAEVFTADNLKTTEGTITKVNVNVNAEGDSELNYKVEDVYYRMKVTEAGEVTILEGPTATEPTLSATVTPSGESVTIGSTVITKDNLGDYLGTAVDYTPAGTVSGLTTESTYRLFYIDFDNDFGDGEGTVYLKADYPSNTTSLTLPTSATTDNKMLQLNPSWKNKTDATKEVTQTSNSNIKAVAWLMEPSNWINLKSSTIDASKHYVVGAPSLDMYVKSYNTYLSKHSGIYKNGSTTEVAENLVCEYTTDSVEGYRIGFENVPSESWANTGYYQDTNSLFSSTEASGMYNPGTSYWLASPAAHYSGNVMCVNGSYSNIGNYQHNKTYCVCPLVSLQSDVTLSWK